MHLLGSLLFTCMRNFRHKHTIHLILKQTGWHPNYHDSEDVIKWKHFPRYWSFVRGIHRSPVNSPRKGLWRRALSFSLICARINGCKNNRGAGDLRRRRAHYDVTVMTIYNVPQLQFLVCIIYLKYRFTCIHTYHTMVELYNLRNTTKLCLLWK